MISGQNRAETSKHGKIGERGERSGCPLTSWASVGPAERLRDLIWVMLKAQKGLESKTVPP